MSTEINLEKFVPTGLYCYDLLYVEVKDNTKPFDGGVIIHTKPCIFYMGKKESCWLMGGEEVFDQCKVCDINKIIDLDKK